MRSLKPRVMLQVLSLECYKFCHLSDMKTYCPKWGYFVLEAMA